LVLCSKGEEEPAYDSRTRQALFHQGVQVAVYPSWHESPYRWVISVFKMKDGARRLWVGGKAVNRVSAAA
jgi:hypothetical protein